MYLLTTILVVVTVATIVKSILDNIFDSKPKMNGRGDNAS